MKFIDYIIIKLYKLYYKYFTSPETEKEFEVLEVCENDILFDYNRLSK